MKLYTPLLVALTVLLVLAANTLYGGEKTSVTIYNAADAQTHTWTRNDVPADRWIGLVVDGEGWKGLASELGTAWSRFKGSRPDFDADVAVVAYMGAMPTGGYTIAVADVQYSGTRDGAGTVKVTLHVDGPSEGAIVTQAFTYPFDVAPIEKGAWPEGVLQGMSGGRITAEAVDQDGRDWGPVRILGTP